VTRLRLVTLSEDLSVRLGPPASQPWAMAFENSMYPSPSRLCPEHCSLRLVHDAVSLA
jgi:hypothetical protein